MRVLKWGAGLASVGVITAVLMNWPGNGDSDAGRASAGKVAASVSNALPVQTKISQKAPSTPNEMMLSTQVQELVATGDPNKLYEAYILLADCVEFNKEHDRMVRDEKGPSAENVFGYRHMTEQEKLQDAKRCGPMTERERQSRIAYLSIAAKAGVPGSAVAFLREGPFGDNSALETRPSDPLVQEWKALARSQLTAEAEAGIDLGAINYLASEELSGTGVFEKNMRLAYRYFLALGLIESEVAGPNSDVAKFYGDDGQLLNLVGADLSPAERAAELAAAQQIAKKFRDSQKAGNANATHG